jgi:small-conductance mechanosensitive channel
MTKTEIRDIITKIHFYLLGFALLNFALKNTIELSLNYRLAYFITLLVYASGIILFFWNFKPFKKIGLYFGIYVITPILTLLFWLFGGIFFALLASIFLYPIYPIELKTENEKIAIYQKYQGFMGMCCPYELTEKKYWFMEKKLMEINLYEDIDFEKASLNSKDGKSELKVKYLKYEFGPERSIETDTIIKIETK